MKKIPVLYYHKELPYTRIQLWLRGGASLEDDRELGFAHLVEHLLYKLRVGGIGLADMVEGRGGHTNAFTSHDFVMVEAVVLNEDAAAVIRFLEEMVSLPLMSIPEQEYAREWDVVFEELLMYEDEPTENLFSEVMRHSFPGHSYGRKIIGERETLKEVTLEKLNRFYFEKMRDRPFLMVAGGYEEEVSFSMACSGQAPAPLISGWTGGNRVVVRHNQRKEYTMACWRLDFSDARNAALLKLLYTVVYGMDGGRFYNDLVYEEKIFDNMSLSVMTGLKARMFLQSGAFSPVNEESRIARWLELWETFHISQAEVARAKEVLLSSVYYNSEGLGKSMEMMAESYVKYGDMHRFEHDYFYTLFHSSAHDLNQYKKEHLSIENAVVGVALPEKSRFLFSPFLQPAQRDKAEDEKAGIEKLKNSYLAVRTRERSSFFSLSLFKKYVEIPSIAGTPGAAKLFLDTLSSSAAGMSKDETEAYLDRYGIVFEPVTGNNLAGFRVKARDSFANEALDIIKKIIGNPLKRADFAQEKRFALSSLSLKKEDPEYLLRRKIRQLIFAGTPYAVSSGGTKQSIEALHLEQVREFRDDFLETGRWGIGASGSVERDELKEKFKFLSASGYRRYGKVATGKKFSFSDQVVRVPVKGKKQRYIALVFPGPDIYDQEFETVRLLDHYLMGQKSPFFYALREEEGLVYSLDVWNMSGVNCGYMALSAITSPDREEKVMERMSRVVEDIRSGIIDETYFEEVKKGMLFQFKNSITHNEFHSYNLAAEAALDLPFENYLQFPDQLVTIDKPRVVEAARRFLEKGLWVLSSE